MRPLLHEIPIVCVTLFGEHKARGRSHERTRAHFKERGVHALYYPGLHAEKLGLRTLLPYEVDNPGSGYNMGPGPTGCWLSHRSLWSALTLLPEEAFLIIEDDAIFPEGWERRLGRALYDVPGDWDMLYAGSCCTSDKPKSVIAGQVYEVKYPMCTHGYLVRKKALPVLIASTDEARCYAPIDISLVLHTLPHLKAYTILPRIIEQHETELSA